MKNVINILLLILIFIFFISIYKHYSSNQNIDLKNFNRENIENIINKKISDLPILHNDTENVIEFNDGFSNKMENDKTRSFWNLLKTK